MCARVPSHHTAAFQSHGGYERYRQHTTGPLGRARSQVHPDCKFTRFKRTSRLNQNALGHHHNEQLSEKTRQKKKKRHLPQQKQTKGGR